jgi:hypothetical protein
MPALADEMARLSKENAALRVELRRAELSSERGEVNFGGVGFGELKKVLETKDLLGFLEQHRLELGASEKGLNNPYLSKEDAQKLAELNMVNLVYARGGGYKLTDSGHAFLTKSEAQKTEEK